MNVMLGPQISSQVLIANTCHFIIAGTTMGGRLACNFGFLDSWSSLGKTSITSTKDTNIRARVSGGLRSRKKIYPRLVAFL